MDDLLSIEETAKRLGGISKWTVHAWLSQGKMQRTKVGGRTMIRESELQRVIEDGGRSPSRTPSHNSRRGIKGKTGGDGRELGASTNAVLKEEPR